MESKNDLNNTRDAGREFCLHATEVPAADVFVFRASPLNELVGLLDLSLLCEVWLAGTLVHFALALPALLYKVYQTEVRQLRQQQM